MKLLSVHCFHTELQVLLSALTPVWLVSIELIGYSPTVTSLASLNIDFFVDCLQCQRAAFLSVIVLAF